MSKALGADEAKEVDWLEERVVVDVVARVDGKDIIEVQSLVEGRWLLSEEEEERRKRAQETIGYMHLSVWIIALRKTKIIFRRNQQRGRSRIS
jgi:hypothetical protein